MVRVFCTVRGWHATFTALLLVEYGDMTDTSVKSDTSLRGIIYSHVLHQNVLVQGTQGLIRVVGQRLIVQ